MKIIGRRIILCLLIAALFRTAAALEDWQRMKEESEYISQITGSATEPKNPPEEETRIPDP